MTATTWEQVAKAKCAQRDAAIPPEWLLSAKVKDNLPLNIMDVPRTCGILTPKDITITETPAVELVAQMVTRELTSVEVTTAFCKRAAIAQQLTNCLTEIFFDQGIEDAAAIDAAYAKTGIPAGALHGLPVSLKDNINLPGLDSTVGFINYANAPADNMAVLAQALKDAGAVFFCKTNVPTGMLMGGEYFPRNSTNAQSRTTMSGDTPPTRTTPSTDPAARRAARARSLPSAARPSVSEPTSAARSASPPPSPASTA
jgi:amidase